MRRRQAILLALSALPVAAGMAACSSILGFEDLRLGDAGVDATTDVNTTEDRTEPPVEAGADVAPDTTAPKVCTQGDYTVPPPTGLTEAGAVTPPQQIVVALESANFGLGALPDASTSGIPGLDLDCVWTCLDGSGPSSCTPPNPLMPPCDGLGGRDLGANNLLTNLSIFEPAFSPTELNRDLQLGRFGVIIRIDGYNGGADQAKVPGVEIFPSSGTMQDAFGTPIPPRFDGNDVWQATSASVGSSTLLPSKFFDKNAYVTNHVLVFHFASFPLLLLPDVGSNKNPAVFTLEDLVGTATLTLGPGGQGGQWRADNGNLAGRWSASNALLGVSTLTDNTSDGASLCGCDSIYRDYKSFLCEGLDIASNAANDGKPLPCDALSFAIGFTAGPAQLASAPYDPPVIPGDCPDAWAPSCNPDASPVCP